MRDQFVNLLKESARNFRDFLPILGVIAVFQLFVVGELMPDLQRRLGGLVLTLVGLTFFVRGLAMSIFPLGEGLADGLARRGSVPLLLAFGFALGFGSTVAEPALAAVSAQAAEAAAAAGHIAGGAEAVAWFSMLLRYIVAAAVGLAVAVGVIRIVKGWPISWLILPGYGLASILGLVSDSALSGIAFDAGAAATSAINVPLMMTLGVGLAATIRGRNTLVDGFGLVAMASLMPIVVILVLSLVLD